MIEAGLTVSRSRQPTYPECVQQLGLRFKITLSASFRSDVPSAAYCIRCELATLCMSPSLPGGSALNRAYAGNGDPGVTVSGARSVDFCRPTPDDLTSPKAATGASDARSMRWMRVTEGGREWG